MQDLNPPSSLAPNSDPLDTTASRARAAMEADQATQDGEATEAQASSKVCVCACHQSLLTFACCLTAAHY
jgi:hypothetical protein